MPWQYRGWNICFLRKTDKFTFLKIAVYIFNKTADTIGQLLNEQSYRGLLEQSHESRTDDLKFKEEFVSANI